MRDPLWEASPGALVALLNSGAPLQHADLYTLTLRSGAVLRWSGADAAVAANGQVWALGPGIKRGQVSWRVGAEVDQLDLTFYTDSARPVPIAGTPLLAYIRGGGLRGARVQLDRVFWGAGAAPVGALLWFSGRVAEVRRLDRNQAELNVVSDLEALTAPVPRSVYQAQCLNTLFDSKCGLSRAAFASTGAASGASDATRRSFATNLGQAAGFFDLGTLTFTAGPNAGLARTVRTHAAGGAITLLEPLPVAVASGQAFEIVPGCNGLQATCSGKFNNVVRFRGQPYIPKPETVT